MPIPALALLTTTLALGPLPESASLRPGQAAPAWTELVGTDGAKHSLADLKDKAAVVVVFFSVNCPDSMMYEDRLIELARDYQSKNVAVVFINSSLLPDDDLTHMTARAKARGYPFPYLFDSTQKVGLAYAARLTPTTFVLDKSRKVAYRGAVDDDFEPKDVKVKYVRDALDAVLAGKEVATKETEEHGCDIDYDL